MRSFAIPALALTALLAGAAQAELYTWTDADGVLHVSDVPRSPRAKKISGSGTAPRVSTRKSRRTTATATPAKKPAPLRWWERRSDAPPDEIDRAAKLYNIPNELIRAVIAAESAGDAGAVSHKGALGLMQLMPQTAGEMYVTDPIDPAQNVMGGTRYLRYLANLFKGDMMLVVAGYNAGPAAVQKYGGIPPFAETRDYVKKVMKYYFELKRDAARTASATASNDPQAPSAKVSAAAEPVRESQP
jgi:soluble lytic murein transglycosylase-like protein